MATAPARRISTQEVSHAVITAAMRVHSELGPGLLERPALLAYSTNCEKPAFVRKLKWACRWYMSVTAFVENLVVVALKVVDAIGPVHQDQLLSYLKLSGKSVGLLINFNVVHLKEWHQTFCERHELALKFFVCLRALGG